MKFDYKNNITCRNLIYHYTKLLNTDTAFQLSSSKIIPYAALITISFPSFPSQSSLQCNRTKRLNMNQPETLRAAQGALSCLLQKQHGLPQSASGSAPHLLLLLFISLHVQAIVPAKGI